jgi:hypothetical protein
MLERVQDAVFVATNPGQTIVPLLSGGTVKVCVSRENYIGFYAYRYLSEEN